MQLERSYLAQQAMDGNELLSTFQKQNCEAR
jgi:hypothetical protein